MITVQPVQTSEVSTLLSMLIELGHSDGVKEIHTTEINLSDALFSPTPAAMAKFVLIDEVPAGFFIYSWKWGTFTGVKDMYVQAIYIHPEHRRKGLGKAIMQHLAKIAVEHTCSRIEWLTVKDKNLSKRFYDAIGATDASHMTIRRLHGQALASLASLE